MWVCWTTTFAEGCIKKIIHALLYDKKVNAERTLLSWYFPSVVSHIVSFINTQTAAKQLINKICNLRISQSILIISIAFPSLILFRQSFNFIKNRQSNGMVKSAATASLLLPCIQFVHVQRLENQLSSVLQHCYYFFRGKWCFSV